MTTHSTSQLRLFSRRCAAQRPFHSWRRLALAALGATALASCGAPPEPLSSAPSPVPPTPVPPTLSASVVVPPKVTASPNPRDLITPRPPESAVSRQTLVSPDGQWEAESSFEQLENDGGARIRLVVRRTDGSREWSPVDYNLDGLGYIYPALRAWSPDSRAFYYFNMSTPDGCGDFYPVEDQWTVLDVEDGSLSSWPLPDGRGHTLSPDGQTLIYATTSPPFGLNIQDVRSGAEMFLALPPPPADPTELQAGGAVWSPDGASLALSIAYGDSCGAEPLSFSVVRIDDPGSPSLTPLIEYSPDLIRLVGWETSERILVRDWNAYSWWIDAVSGNTTQGPEIDGS